MKILITGGTGILGKELKKIFPDSLSPTRNELDITDLRSVENFLTHHNVDVIIHTAALTSVRKCEDDKQLCWLTNVQGTKNLVNTCQKLSPETNFVYVSTACVFDGHSEMYDENSVPYPENFYALTKLLGEQHVSKLKNSLIVRTNFVGKEEWPYPKAFTDRFGTYLFADIVAKGISDILNEDMNGIVHLVGDKKISMYDLAKILTPSVQPMTLNDYSGPPLTIDMSLDTKKWKKYHLEK